MNALDRAIAWFSPQAAARRAHFRRVLSYYEAGRVDKQRKQRREAGTGDTATYRAGLSLREQARHFDQNHDIAINALNILEQNVVGPNGIGVEPMPRNTDGSINTELSREILRLRRNWERRPEVTWCHDMPSAERLLARTWFRDGEALVQHLVGPVALLDHGTQVPYSVEMMEPDYLPMHLNGTDPWITMGIERNAWGRPVAYHVHKQHPGDALQLSRLSLDTKRVPAARMSHLKNVTRIGQARGVSIFAAVMSRLDDLKDYEESERIAAKVAASMAAYIKKGAPDDYAAETDDNGDPEARDLKFRAGMVFDDLLPGEDIGTIDTSRPNTSLEAHRNGQLRAASGGFRVSYSSLSKDYNGTYSAQRQELVEQFGAYGVLSSEFIGQIVRPMYVNFITAAIASRALQIPGGVVPESVFDAMFVPPQMPWIDPKKEAEGWALLDEHDYASGYEIVRRRGMNPIDVLDQSQRWAEERAKRGLGADQTSNIPSSEQDDAQQLLEEQTNARRRA